MLVLYDGTTSVCGIKARVTLFEKGLKFESRNIDLRKGEQFAPDYLTLNPNAVVPTLIDGDDIILESSVIIQYLEDIGPAPSLLPESPLDRARMRLWLKRIDDPIQPATGTLTHATAFRPAFLKKRQKNKKRILQTCLTQHVGRDRRPYTGTGWRHQLWQTRFERSISS